MKFSGILICSDVDGTLAKHGDISHEHRRAVEYFQKNGGLFTLATGRHPQYAQGLYEDVRPNTYLIADNGMSIFDIESDTVLHEWSFNDDPKALVSDILDRFPSHEYMRVHVSSGYYNISAEKDKWQKEFASIGEPIHKIVFRQQEQQTSEMMLCFENDERFTATQSCDVLFEILPKNCGKGTAVQKLRELLSGQIHTVICIGDYHNDISMLQYADIAVAVDGGDKRILPYADWIAPKYEDHPIQWLIRKIERELL